MVLYAKLLQLVWHTESLNFAEVPIWDKMRTTTAEKIHWILISDVIYVRRVLRDIIV